MCDAANPIVIEYSDPESADARRLIDALSAALLALTGDDGRRRALPEDLRAPGGLFLLARDAQGGAVGCGGLRVLDAAVGEIKRMYAAPGSGAGAAILRRLEEEAHALGLRRLVLSTRRVNERALSFYRRHGYRHAAAYGDYIARPESVCLERSLLP
jgi:GNAT superfamily N-acetyltransferase